ncbi:hypothetical protein RSAG8_05840, partial [Rhizoctonia solani AG-8 WAC10335]
MKSMFAFVALFVGYAAAQSSTASAPVPTSTAGVSPCIGTCSATAAQAAGCNGITDVACLCASSDFQTAALECFQSQCPDEVAAATALQQQICGATGTGTASTPAATGSAGAAVFNLAATGAWAAAALGGAVVAQLVL